MKRTLTALVAAAGLVLAALPARAAWPEKPIEAIVPWPAGQELDILARTIVPAMSKNLGVPVAVINRPGGGGVVGTSDALRARNDGYTILFNSVGPMLTQPLAGNAPYKVGEAEPIGMFNSSTFVVIARADAPYKTIQEFEAWARKSGKPVVLGHFGPAALPTQTVARMAKQKGWTFRGVTFSPAGPAQLKSGDAEIVTAPYNTAKSAIAAGEVRALVTFNPTRLADLPNVPTLREAGYDLEVVGWQALFVPRGTSPEVKARLATALQAALKDPAVVELAARINTPIFWKNGDETAASIRADEQALRPLMEALALTKN